MKRTWEWSPDDRPASTDLALELDTMLAEHPANVCACATLR
jgi:hypothetical protein